MNRIREGLTYANVVSTLALFLVLAGGSAFAATKLGSNTVGTKQIKNGAVTTAKIKNGAITGAKVNLATLGTVPSATSAASATSAGHADSAGTADSATTAGHASTAGHADSADTATSATSAGHADSADTATDADALGGLPPQGYMSSDRFAFGTADTEPDTPQTVLTLGGIEVTTNRPETAPDQFAVRIVNRNADQWEFTTTGEPGIITLSEGLRGVLGPIATAGSMVINGRDRFEPNKAIVIQCGSDIAPDLLECFAQLSPDA